MHNITDLRVEPKVPLAEEAAGKKGKKKRTTKAESEAVRARLRMESCTWQALPSTQGWGELVCGCVVVVVWLL